MSIKPQRYFSKERLLPHVYLIILSTLFIVITFCLLCSFFRYQINPDAMSYFTIAEKYAHFDFANAFNGYWGPLISWLLVPAAWLNIPLDLAARAVNIVIGVIILVISYRYLLRQTGKTIANILCTFLAIIMTDWILLGPITPDLLMALIIILFALTLSRYIDAPSVRTGAALGALGGLMYLTKAFGFFMFLVIIAIVLVWHYFTQGKRNIPETLKWVAPIVIAFTALVLPFAICISIKYGTPTISVAGEYNMRVNGPGVKGLHPIITSGPLTPPNESAVSAWEDPSYQTALMPEVHIFESKHSLVSYLNNIVRNIDETSKFILETYAIVTIGMIAMVMGVFQRKNSQKDYVIFLLVSAVLCGGYALVFTEDRYIWAATFFSVYAFGLLVSQIQKKKALSWLQIVIGGSILGACMFFALFSECKAFVLESKINASQSGESKHATALALASYVPTGSHIISDDFYSYFYCYYMRAQCYNILTPPVDAGKDDEYVQQLKDLSIIYFLNFHTRDGDARVSDFISKHFTLIEVPGANSMLYKLN